MQERANAKALLGLGLESDEADIHAGGTRFGDYELVEEIGRGAQAVVFRARHAGIRRTVALKLMVGGDLATEPEVRRFRFGAEAAANLDHPNIVPVFHVGECDGRPFFTMRLLEGGNLKDSLPSFRHSPAAAALLMAKVARAVQHAHDRGVLHRDLKPANIVLDEKGEPYVVDFGLALSLEDRASTSTSADGRGTLDYMAPEQAIGRSRDLTVAADVYALGAILYELLTGRVPFEGATVAEVFEKMAKAEPVRPPSAVDPAIDQGLSLVCAKCLEREPERRYRSAEALAIDLERWRNLEPLSVAPAGLVERALHWCRRQPVMATVFAGTFVVLSVASVVGWSVAQGQQAALRREVLEVNKYAAHAIASRVLLELRDLSERLIGCASDPRVAARIADSAKGSATEATDVLLRECGAESQFDSVTLFDVRGIAIARAPVPPYDYVGKDFSFRDYFIGAKRLGEAGDRGTYAGKALWSEADGQLKLSLSAPVLDSQNRWVGVVNATIGSDSSLGSLRMRDSGRQLAVLAGPRDRERNEPLAQQTSYMVLVHDKLAHGRAVPIEGPRLDELSTMKPAGNDAHGQFHAYGPERTLSDDRHVDPVQGFEGRWLAGFAPVGDTGYVVIVQTGYDTAMRVPERAFFRVVGWCAAVLAAGAAIVFSIARVLAVRRRARRA